MIDKISKEKRRINMQAIKSQSQLENKVTKALWGRGIRFRKNNASLFGKPDISIKKYKIVIFIDSCFWHGCPQHGKIPSSNVEFWEKKINKNRERDSNVAAYYIEKNWHIYRVWEHELKDNFEKSINDLVYFINSNRN